MSTITKEWLQQKIADMEAARDDIPFGLDEDDSNTLAAMKLALASIEAEAVAFVMADDLKDSSIISTPAYRDLGEAMERTVGNVVALYAAHPAPVSVPDEVDPMTCHLDGVTETYAEGWNACRDAMLQGAENAESRCSIQAAPALDSSPKIAESRCSNSSVVPDGYVLVPVEPTSEMQSAAAGAIRFNTTPINKLWTGNAVYKAMIAAAPQKEVKP